MQALKSLISDFSHLFFPHVCVGCGTDVLGNNAVLCIRCMHQLPVTNFHLYANNSVEKIFTGRLPLVSGSSWCYFTQGSVVQSLLHQLKYRGNKDVGYLAGRMMGELLVKSARFNDVDVLVPLPLFAAREKKRGYNQAAILCEGIAAIMRLPVLSQVVVRNKATKTQTHKNRVDRWKNIEGKFELNDPDVIKHKHVLLVDDVITTGATLEACGQELLSGGQTRLSITSMAYTVI